MMSTLSQLPTRRTAVRRTASFAAGMAATLTLAACSGGSSGSASSAASTSSGGTNADGKSVVVILAAPNDPFWSTVKRGAESAASAVEAAGGTVTYLNLQNYNNVGPDLAKLIANAQALNPSVVVAMDGVPEAQNPGFIQLSQGGVPVFLYNSGQDQVEATGAVTYIGTDDYTAGVAGGEKFAASAVKNVLCVNTLPGSVNIDARCEGIKDGAEKGGSTSTQLSLPASQFGDPSAVAQAIKGALVADSTIDGVVTIGVADSDSAASAIGQADAADRVQLGTFDVSNSGLERISAGAQLFSIDQQPFAQGYYAVSSAFQYVAYGIKMPQNPLLTGPNVIDADNVDAAVSGSKLGVR